MGFIITFLLGMWIVACGMVIIYPVFPKMYFITINNNSLKRLKILGHAIAFNILVFILIFILAAIAGESNFDDDAKTTLFLIGMATAIVFVIFGIFKKYNFIVNDEKPVPFSKSSYLEENKNVSLKVNYFDGKISNSIAEKIVVQPQEIVTPQIEPVVEIIDIVKKERNKESSFDQKQAKIKLNNVFLGFIEGIFIDGKINYIELEALIRWVEYYPECTEFEDFEYMLKVVEDVVKNPELLTEKHAEILKVLNLFKNTDFYIHRTADSQWLHGLLAGLVCDKSLTVEEVELLNIWLKDNDHIEDDPIYMDLFEKLRPYRLTKSVNDDVIKDILKSIQRYVNYDDYGLPVTAVTSSKDDVNPDFYHGAFSISGFSFCFTGASSRYTKAEWQSVVENRGGTFAKSMTKSVDYLVVCNKGNPNWAHMSYGRKFEQALKWQREGLDIKILTEDDFVKELEK